MKKLFALCLLMVATLSLSAKTIKEFVVTTQPQMSCQNCENKIKKNLRFEKGVTDIRTDLQNQLVVVTYDADKTNEANITKAFGKLDYKVTPVNASDAVNAQATACPKGKGTCQSQSSCQKKCGGKADKKCDGTCKKATCKNTAKKCDGTCKNADKKCDGKANKKCDGTCKNATCSEASCKKDDNCCKNKKK